MSYAYGPYIKGDISSLSEIAISSPKLKKVGTYYIHISLCKKISNSEKKIPKQRERWKPIHDGESNKLANQ